MRLAVRHSAAAAAVALALAGVAGAAKGPPAPERVSATFTIKRPTASTSTCRDERIAYTRTYGDYRGSAAGSFEGAVRLRVVSYVNGEGLGWISGGSLSIEPAGKSAGRRVGLSFNAIVDGRRATGFAYGQVMDVGDKGKVLTRQILATVTLDLDAKVGVTGGRIGAPGRASVPAQAIVHPQSCR